MHKATSFKGDSKLRRRWLIWMITSIIIIGYLALAKISTLQVVTPISINFDNEIKVSVFRVFDSWLEFGLLFPQKAENCEQEIELGSWSSSQKQDGFLMLTPGVEIKIAASIASLPSVEYEAMPATTGPPYCRGNDFRNMTSNVSVEPGKYQWPAPLSTPSIRLHSGFNTIRFHVNSVGKPDVGEAIKLIVLAPLTLKSTQKPFIWFALGLLWPAFVFIQAIWAICLLIFNRKQMSPTP